MKRSLLPLLLTLCLAGACAQSRVSAWEHYDGCTLQYTSFAAMVDCGRARWDDYCTTRRSEAACGAQGSAVVVYAESLNKMIENKRITEPEARKKWAEFELLSPAEQARVSQATAAAAAR
jgi:hypothetical protein